MGTQASKSDQKAPRQDGMADIIPELFRFMACDGTQVEDEVSAEITSWPSSRQQADGFSPQVVDKRRPQPGTPTAGRRAAEGALQTPTRSQECDRYRQAKQDCEQAIGSRFKVGDLVELWSKSQQAWCRGSIEKIEGTWVHIAYAGPEGQPMTKIMPCGHEELRVPGGNQGIENANTMNGAFPAGQGGAKNMWDPALGPPSARQSWASPQHASPNRSPLNPLHYNQSPMQAEAPVHVPAPPAPYDQGPSPGGLFNLPGLSLDIFKPGAPAPPSPAPDAFAGMNLFGSMNLLGPQPPITPTGAMGFQPNAGLTPPGSSPQGWNGSASQSPSQHGLVSLAPGTLGAGAGQAPAREPYQEPEVHGRVPLNPNVERIEPEEVHRLMQSNQCVLIDLRGDDRAVGLIPGAIHVQAIDTVPFMQKIPGLLQRFQNERLVIFTCQYSAHRAPQCSNWYKDHAVQANPNQRVAILSGGFRHWDAIGLPTESMAGGNKYEADAYALLQGVQFTQKPQEFKFSAQPGSIHQAMRP